MEQINACKFDNFSQPPNRQKERENAIYNIISLRDLL